MIVNKTGLNKLGNLMLTKMMKICKWTQMSLKKKKKNKLTMKARKMLNQGKMNRSNRRRIQRDKIKVSSLV